MTKYFTTIMAALAFVFTCQSCNSGNAQQNVDLDIYKLLGEAAQKQTFELDSFPGEENVNYATDILTGAQSVEEYLPLLKGKRVCILSNQCGIVTPGVHVLDTLLSLGINVTCIMSPEHGFRGDADAGEAVGNSVDSKTGVPIKSLYGSKNNTDVLYFGGDEDLTPIGNEPADNVGATFDETGAPISDSESDESMSSQYYSADVDIRPAISRLEIGKIAIQNTGSGEVSVQYNNNPEKTYVVEYSGFQPELVGIYMSNFYGTLTPVNATLGNYFPTPEETGVISAGLWDNNKINKTADIAAAYNKDGITLYSNYASGSYSALFANAPATEGEKYGRNSTSSSTIRLMHKRATLSPRSTTRLSERPKEMWILWMTKNFSTRLLQHLRFLLQKTISTMPM